MAGRLIDPGPGELSDRLTILTLKILFGQDTEKRLQQERAVILTKLRAQTLNGKWFEGYTDLAAVNAALWQAEDELRTLRQDYREGSSGVDVTAREIAFRIQELNDRRAELIHQINRETGDGAAAQ